MAREFGWAYVVGSQASGPKGSVQLAGDETALDHDPNLIWSDDLNALLVSGNIIAHNFEIQNQTKTVFNFEVSGSSIFGDTPDDLHQFTGSIDVSGTVTAHSFAGYGGDLEGVAINYYTNAADNRLVTSVGEKSVNAEENLLFDGSLLSVIGNIEATQVSSSVALFETGSVVNLDVSRMTNGALTIENSSLTTTGDVSATNISGLVITPSQTSITDVGTLNSLSVSGDATLGLDVISINSSLKRVGVSKTNPQTKFEIKDNLGPQMRLTNSDYMFGISSYQYTDLTTTNVGDFRIQPTSGKVIIPQLNLTNVQIGSANNFLSLDSNGNVILAPSVQAGIEVRNRTVVSGSYSMATDDYFIGLQATQNLTVTLPDASTLFNGQIFVIKDEAENADVYTLDIVPQANQFIENRTSLTLSSPGSAINIYCDGQSKFFIM